MEVLFDEYLISDEKSSIQIDRVCDLLSNTYWAKNRSKSAIQKTIDNSFCFGIYKDDILVGFARCITDFAVMYYLADVVIDEKYRGQGLGNSLVKFITEHEKFSCLLGVLETRDAHGLYERFGFKTSKGFAMRKTP